MNREIKFRAWDTFNKLMWGQDKCYEKDLATFFREYQDAINGENEPILMQYTGLKDKNGKEIYEGDILKESALRGYMFEVKFSSGCFIKYQIAKQYSHFSSNLIDALGNLELEVIGNIYENPELLK